MTAGELDLLGPLGCLQGTWEGDGGDDRAPSDNRGVESNPYREVMVFEPTGLVQNHEQHLYGLRYRTTAWRLGEDSPFHEELGYWLWDATSGQVMRCFMVPRGVTIIAGGTVAKDALSFALRATLGSSTFGICSNPFLDREFRTVQYDLTVTFTGQNNFSYEENTQLAIKGQKEIFNHTDKNNMRRKI